MRIEFSAFVAATLAERQNAFFLTGDLGFMAFEQIQDAFPDRFINVGVCEQQMVSFAAGLASEGLLPFCYSIAPFAVFRPAEQIRLDVCLHNLNVKIIGNGGGYGYGIMGATHHAIEDIAVLSSFQKMKCFIPCCNADVAGVAGAMMDYEGPSYLRLGFGKTEDEPGLLPYQPIRQLRQGDEMTVIALGPIWLNCLNDVSADIFVVSEMPVPELSDALIASITKTRKVLVVEEHVERGGLGEHLAKKILATSIPCTFDHAFAKGYPNQRYGSQAYHQRVNELDPPAIAALMRNRCR